MSYRQVEEKTYARGYWGTVTFRTYKCGFCGAYCTCPDSSQPPAKCGKCKL